MKPITTRINVPDVRGHRAIQTEQFGAFHVVHPCMHRHGYHDTHTIRSSVGVRPQPAEACADLIAASRKIINEAITRTTQRLNEIKIVRYHLRSQRAVIKEAPDAATRGINTTHLDLLIDEYDRAYHLLTQDYAYEHCIWREVAGVEVYGLIPAQRHRA